MLPRLVPPGPPLEPSGDQARRLLRAELLHSEYHRDDLWNRFLAWVGRLFRHGAQAASGSSAWTALLTMVVVVLLLGGLVFVLTRVRRDRRDRTRRAEGVLLDRRAPAAELRRRAEQALAEGRHEDAVVDGFRALAVRQLEQGRLEDRPGATAHEIAARLATSYGDQARRVRAAADLFDATLYGDRPATAEQAREVLALDDDLARTPVGAR